MADLNLTTESLKDVLIKVADDLRTHTNELRELDAQTGDGDLGVTIELASKGITGYVESTSETDAGKFLAQCGMNINKVSPSTFGTILAAAFMGAGKALTGTESVTLENLVIAGEGAIENVKKRGKAEAGDKTLLDVLIPAVETLRAQIASGSDAATAMNAVVQAAEEGMKSTVTMKAKFGRAQWFQNGSIGIQDGGATAAYYLIKAFAEAVL